MDTVIGNRTAVHMERSSAVPCRHGPQRRCSSCPPPHPVRTSGLLASHSACMPSRLAPATSSHHVGGMHSATVGSQCMLLTQAPEQVVSASARLVEMIDHDPTAQEEIRTAGGVRSAVFLLKLSQAAGNQRVANATSRLLLHLARDNSRNQDEICALDGIPCLVDVLLTFASQGDSCSCPRSPGSCPQSPCRELLELTEAVQSAAEVLGLLAGRHARAIARAGGVEVSNFTLEPAPRVPPPSDSSTSAPRLPTHLPRASPSRRSFSRCLATATARASR